MTIIAKVLSLLLLAACGNLEQSEEEKSRLQNASGEYILRRDGEILFPVDPPKQRAREKYPWEEERMKAKG
ncbi:MAG: hypothetical protein ACHQT8_08005 [Chlamydiales bacterium]